MAMSVEQKNKPGSHPALAYRPQDYMAAAAVGPLVYPTTTTAGWTVVHHGTLGPPREPYVPPSSGRRAHSATRNLPISGSSSSSSPAIPSAAPPARPLPVPPPLDTVSVGSTTFTRRPNASPNSPQLSDKGKRRASVSALAIPGASPDPSGPVSAISPTGRPLPPLPPPVAGPSSSRPVASSSSQAGSSRKTQKSPRKDSRTRQRTPDAAFRVANPSASASSSYVAPTTTRPNAGPSPTLPFDGVSGVWAPRPAADSHSRGIVTGPISRKASPSLSRKPSTDLLPAPLSRKMSSEAMQERERTIRRQASAEQQRITAGQQPVSRRPSIQRQNSGGAKKKGSAPSTPAAGSGFNPSPVAQSSAVLGAANLAKRKSSLPPGVGAGGGPPSPFALTHSRSPSSSGSTPVNTTKPPPPPPLVTARPTHGHTRAASLSGPLVPPPPPPPLLPYGEGSRSATSLSPATPFVPPPPPPPLVTIRTAAARVAARGTAGSSSSGPSPISTAGSSAANSPTPSPAPPPPLTMGAVLRAQRGSPASAGLHGGHSGYTTSPLASASTANSTPASSAWHRWDDGSGSGSGSGWSAYEESPATAATTPASSREWHGSDIEKETDSAKRDRRRAQLTSPIDVDVGVEPGPLTPPIHSHPLDEDDGANPDSARDEQSNQWLSALEGEVKGDEMNGVSLSPPVFASSGDPDLDEDLDDDDLDLYDDGDIGNDNTFTAPEPSQQQPQRAGSRSPSPIRYARRSSVDADMILSDSSEEDSEDERPIPDGASMDSNSLSFNDAKSTFSRARSVRSRRRRRNTRPAPPPVPLASAAGLNRRRARSRSADSSDGYREAMAPSEMWKMEQAAKAGESQTEMRVVYRSRETRLPASIPPILGATDSYASLSTGSPSASQSGHGSTEQGYGYRTSPNTSKSSLPLALPRKDTLRLLRRDKNKDKDKSRDRSMRKSNSFSLLRGNNAADKSINSSMEGLVLRGYPERYERASTSSSGGSDEAGQQGRPMRVGGGNGGNGGKPGLRNYLYDPTR